MARPTRLEFAGALYLVTTVAGPARKVFAGEVDRADFLDVYAQVEGRLGWKLLAYALLEDHYLLLVETPRPNLSRGMRQLNGVYTQRHNQRHGEQGKVFQGRFKAVIVDASTHLRTALREVLNAPRRARVRRPEQWTGSSLPWMLGRAGKPDWLCDGEALAAFGRTTARAREALRAYLAEPDAPALADLVRHQIFLGSDAFIARLRRRRSDAGNTLQARRRPALERFVRGMGDEKTAMARAYLSGNYRMDEIAAHYGVHYSTVSRAVKAYEQHAH